MERKELDRGAYLIVLFNNRMREMKVGALGKILFEKGYYIYVGSAMNGIDARLSRHFSDTKKRFWHIDYIIDRMGVVDVKRILSDERVECDLACKIKGDARGFVKNFGSSDCNCKSHLYYFKKRPIL